MNYINMCLKCLDMYRTDKKRSRVCNRCRYSNRDKQIKDHLNRMKYKNRFCERCDIKFRTLKKRPKICPECTRKPYPLIFAKV